jgi:hypothetical protein
MSDPTDADAHKRTDPIPSLEERVAELVRAAGELTAGEAQACARLVVDARGESRSARPPVRAAA